MKDYKNFIAERVNHYYWNEDLNCAVTTLKILSEIFEISVTSQVFDSAIGMPGAGRFGAQCGIVDGTLMFIGILGKKFGYPKEDIVTFCYNFSNHFQDLCGSLNCESLRPQGFKPENPPHICEDLTIKAIELSVNCIKESFNLDKV